MIFLTRDGNYIEINRSTYINDIMYYHRIITARGYKVNPYQNDTNNKLIDIGKRR